MAIRQNVKVYNHLSEGLKYINYTSTKGTFNPDTGIWDIGDVLGHHKEFLYVTTLAVSIGEKINSARLTTDSINLNNITYEEEEIDVHERHYSSDKNHHSLSFNVTGNPVVLVLVCLFGCITGYIKRKIIL